ncbi:hypothetical protein ACJQWK_11220 [Exserohilum turcicum]
MGWGDMGRGQRAKKKDKLSRTPGWRRGPTAASRWCFGRRGQSAGPSCHCRAWPANVMSTAPPPVSVSAAREPASLVSVEGHAGDRPHPCFWPIAQLCFLLAASALPLTPRRRLSGRSLPAARGALASACLISAHARTHTHTNTHARHYSQRHGR